MKICLDLRTVGEGPHGIARYGIELTRALQALGTTHRLVLLNRKSKVLDGLKQAGTSVLLCPARPYSLEEHLVLPFALGRLRPDLYHCPTYACPILAPAPILLTIHDLLPLEYPHDFSSGLKLYHRSIVRWTAKRAKRILTVSSYSFTSICRQLPVSPAKVRVIPEGGDHLRRFPASDLDERAYREINPEELDYFLSVANPRPHKNILFSMRCLLGSEALRRRKVAYVLVGRQHPSVYAYAKDRDRESRIRFAGQISEGLLRLLYERAVALLCPSRGEGFCLPAVEAMQFGLPVIAADDGALPEVLGGSGLLLPLDDAHTWKEAVEHVYEQRKQGLWDASPVIEQAGRFSWASTAKQTMALYEEVYRETRRSAV